MRVTDVKILWRNREQRNPLAICSITLDGVFVVSSLKVMSGAKGDWVAMPSQKVKDDYKDTCFPISKDLREHIFDAVLTKFRDGAPQEPFAQQPQDDTLPF